MTETQQAKLERVLNEDDRFLASLSFVLRQEGGWSDVPGDTGRQTMEGVTLATFRTWRKDPAATPDQLRAITDAEVASIYRDLYWTPLHCAELPAGLSLQVLDFGINAGIGASAKVLQYILKVPVDGTIGPVTIAAAKAAGIGLVTALSQGQANYYRSLNAFKTFGAGWLARDDRRAAAALVAYQVHPDAPTADVAAAALTALRASPVPVVMPPFLLSEQPPIAVTPPAATIPPDPKRVVSVSLTPGDETSMTDIADIAAGALKGGLAGAPLGPVGMAGGAAIGLAVQLVPGLTRWLSGDDGVTAANVVDLVQQATGSTNPAAQAAAIQVPQIAGDLAVQLAQIVADREAAQETAQLESFKAGLADVMAARSRDVQVRASSRSGQNIRADIMLGAVTIGLLACIFAAATGKLGYNTAVFGLVAGIAGMLTGCFKDAFTFEFGSSRQSENKTNIIADMAANTVPASLLPAPAAIIPAKDVKAAK